MSDNEPSDSELFAVSRDFVNRYLEQCIANPDLLRQYDRLNGTDLSRRGSPIDLMIDDACGKMDADARGFFDFCMEQLNRVILFP